MAEEQNGTKHSSLARDLAQLVDTPIYIASVTDTKYRMKETELEAISEELSSWLRNVIGIAKKYKAEAFTVDVGGGFPPTVSASFNWTKDVFPEEHEA